MELLDVREKTHGDYSVQAAWAQRIKDLYRQTLNWNRLSGAQKEALDMDATKTARILWGDPNVLDHWVDKEGYRQLVIKSFEDNGRGED